MRAHHLPFIALLCLACGTPDGMVDETGYFGGEKIYYTSEAALSAEESPVSVVGTPGALLRPGGALTVTNARSGQILENALLTQAQGFIAELRAQKGDALILRYEDAEGGESLTLTLADGLDAVPAPTPCLVCMGYFAIEKGDGTLSVALSFLRNVEPPVLIFNASAGDSLLVETVTASVSLPGTAGHRVCASAQGAAGRSTSYCDIAR